MEKLYNQKISIIIPTFNREHKILNAVDSVLRQDYKNWELIVVDDGSTDNTRNKIFPYLSDLRIKYFYQSNRGVASARNVGILKATGIYVVFLDSDDEFLNDKLRTQLFFHKKFNNPFSISNSIETRDGIKFKKGYESNTNFLINKKLFIKNKIPCGAGFMMCDRELISHMLFDENLKALEDTELVMRYLGLYDLTYICKPLIKRSKSIQDDRLSSNNLLKINAYNYLINKIDKSMAGFNKNEIESELKHCHTQVAIFYLLSGNFVMGRFNLKKAYILGGFDFKLCLLYLISLNKILFKIAFIVASFFWKFRIINI